MTIADIRDKVMGWKDFVTTACAILAVLFPVLTAGVLAIWGDDVRKWSQDFLGITLLTHEIEVLTGANRVIRQPEGMSYVEEPVYYGDEVVLILYMARTQKGAACMLTQRTAVWTDANGVSLAGPEGAVPPSRQIGTDLQRLEVRLQPPPQVQPGHATVQLQLTYTCPGSVTPIFESTAAVSFYILPARQE